MHGIYPVYSKVAWPLAGLYLEGGGGHVRLSQCEEFQKFTRIGNFPFERKPKSGVAETQPYLFLEVPTSASHVIEIRKKT